MKQIFKIFAALVCVLLGLLLLPKLTRAEGQSIIITEIAAYEKSNFEWIEIYNTASESIDMAGWKFWENEINHRLNEYRGDLIIEPGEYAIIADVAENVTASYPEFTGTIIDSSWSSLRESGEEIGLKDAEGNIIELVIYPSAPNFSLQRKGSEWIEHASGNSIGKENEFDDLTPPSAEQSKKSSDSITPTSSVPYQGGKVEGGKKIKPRPILTGTILINEFVSDPSDSDVEWIELYNKNGFEVDLNEWKIIDGSNKETALSGTLNPDEYYVIEKPKGRLNNGGDIIILKDSAENVIDQVSYGDFADGNLTDNAPAAKDPDSVARIIDGVNNFNPGADFAVTQTPTKGSENFITSPPQTPEEIKESIAKAQKSKSYSNNVIINEIYPNPPGSDFEYEFIELKNIGDEEVNLHKWILRDKSKYEFKIKNLSIDPQKIVVIERRQSGLALNNDKDEVRLINPKGKTVDKVKYSEEIFQDVAYARNDELEWELTISPTKGAENIISHFNHPPTIEIYCPKKGVTNEMVECDASDSFDTDNDPISFHWEINNTSYQSPIVQFDFQEKGRYFVRLTISDQETSAEKIVKITISEPDSSKITISTAENEKSQKIQSVSPEIVQTLKKGAKVVTQGIVTVLPKTFSKQIMYINGLQVYMNKAQWPALQRGDKILASGTVSEIHGEKRINITSAKDILFMEMLFPPEPKPVSIQEIDIDEIGELVSIAGSFTEVSASKAILDDEEQELVIKFKKGTGIKKSDIVLGERYIVSGVISLNGDTYELLPRDTSDLQKVFLKSQADEPGSIATRTTNKTILKFLFPITLSLFTVIAVMGTKKYVFKK